MTADRESQILSIAVAMNGKIEPDDVRLGHDLTKPAARLYDAGLRAPTPGFAELAGVSCDYGKNPCDLNVGHEGPHHNDGDASSEDRTAQLAAIAAALRPLIRDFTWQSENVQVVLGPVPYGPGIWTPETGNPDGNIASALYDAGLRSGALPPAPLRTADDRLVESILRDALLDLLEDTEHKNHDCEDEDCPVSRARAALRATPDTGALPEQPPATDRLREPTAYDDYLDGRADPE